MKRLQSESDTPTDVMDIVATPPDVVAPLLSALPQHLLGAEGFPEVLEALQRQQAATVDGAWKSSAALVAATLALRVPQTLLVVIAHPHDLDPWDEDLRSFSGQRPWLFPAWDSWPPRQGVLDEVAAQRLRLLKLLDSDQPPRMVLTTMQALLQPVPSKEQLTRLRRRLRVGEQAPLEELQAWLVEHGFQRMEAVELPGEFSRRGGILDVFSQDANNPVRIEFFGDEIESIRQFTVETQRSLADLQSVDVTGGESANSPPTQPSPSRGEGDSQTLPGGVNGHLCDYLPARSWIVLLEPEELHEQGKHFLERTSNVVGLFSLPGAFQQLLRYPTVRLTALPSPSLEVTCHLRVESVERFSGDVARVRDELDTVSATDRVLIACHNEASRHRLSEVLAQGQLVQSGRLHLTIGRVHAGFRLLTSGLSLLGKGGAEAPLPPTPSPKRRGGAKQSPSPLRGGVEEGLPLSSLSEEREVSALVVLGDHELFCREDIRTVVPRRQIESRAIDSFLDLQEGDLVVHVSHGIARYRGLHMMEQGGQVEEHLILEFRDAARLYVPTSQIELVQKYVGGGRSDPELSKLGGTAWQRRKQKVEEAVLDLASEMIQLQAVREAKPGIAYPADTDWQKEFEAAFPYEETPDQLTSLTEIKRDLERPRPMDRLVCGDVGYGKTELAIRAAFKTIDNGKQVAVLVPTTVLAEQHYRTFSQRLAEYPFIVDVVSRFRTGKQQREILKQVASGGVDIIIGTHRLLSQDVQFHDLGLVIIDEEQRFGVDHKERLKRLRQMVDVLTLTATPIPRTLHLALLGIRDISNLETPPRDRLAIETRIVRWDEQLIRHAILRELNREGQIYFVHNRVQNIHDIASRLLQIVPEARIAVGHGQMHEDELEEAMVKFITRQADILVATTIIESGLDIPNANTIFINQADNYGLADLHQLRGRVGRSKHRAYAYLILDSERAITDVASRRLKAIEEFTELGAGFKIAMRDLEIRGTGNILGTQQSGHIAAIGYELYCQLLENAVRKLKKQPLRTPLDVSVDLPWSAYLPRDYVPGQKLKIEVYRRLSRLRKLDRLEDFVAELRDRFGLPPEPVQWLLRLAELRLLAARWQVADIHLEGQLVKYPEDPTGGTTDVVLGYRNARRIKALAERSAGRLRIVDHQSAYFRLHYDELSPLPMYTALQHLLRLPERKV